MLTKNASHFLNLFRQNFSSINDLIIKKTIKDTLPSCLKYNFPFTQTKLFNGIRICTEKIQSPVSSIGVFINSGSRYEAENASGSAHFLEHILFKGTKFQSKDLFELEIEQQGSSINAYTSREHTLFHIECFNKNLPRSLEVLSQMVQYPLISKKAVQNEKDTIQAELINSYSDPADFLMEMGHSCVFGRNTSMGRPILGDINNIKNVTQEMVKNFFDRQYIAENFIVVGVGDIDHKYLVELVQKYFRDVRLKRMMPSKADESFIKRKPKFIHSNIAYLLNEECTVPGVSFFYSAPNWYDRDYYVLMVIERIINLYSNDKLLKFKAFYNPYRDCGIFGILAVGEEKALKERELTKQFYPIEFARSISKETIRKAKNKLIMELLNIQSPSELMFLIGPQILYLDRRVSKYEIAKRILFLDEEVIKKKIFEYFVKGNPSVIGLGKRREIERIINSNINEIGKLIKH